VLVTRVGCAAGFLNIVILFIRFLLRISCLKKISSSDVAKKAGVSRTTVSFVLNNTPGKKIPEQTRLKVLKTVQELGYVVDDSAREIAMAKHYTVGLFICHTKSFFSDAYIIKIIEGMAPVFNKNRVRLILNQIRLDQKSYLQLAKQDQLDGIILINTHDDDQALHELIDSGFPLVVIGTLENRHIRQVDIDTINASRIMTDYLIESGHKRIGTIIHAHSAYDAARLRYEGFQKSMKNAGLAINENWVRYADFSEESGFREMEALLQLEELPTAVFATNDAVAFGAMEAVKAHQLKIPDDISLCGFDDDYLSRFLNPPLTTIA